jgi:hypothetical protein
MIIAGAMFIDPRTLTDIMGAFIFAYLYFSQRFNFSMKDWIKNRGRIQEKER